MANIHGRFLPMAQYRGLRTDCGSGGACFHARPRKRIRCGGDRGQMAQGWSCSATPALMLGPVCTRL